MLKLNYGGSFVYEVTEGKNLEEIYDTHSGVQDGFERRIKAAIDADRFKKIAVLEPKSLKFCPSVSGSRGSIKFNFIFSPTIRGYFRLICVDLKNIVRSLAGKEFLDLLHDIF
ncbi:MAG: hypothetical protein MUD12_02875 [Spirochaetes bacterium]|jgi:hypothetical protein|nr:hypothetical protein [Spirochaetota bacterium]